MIIHSSLHTANLKNKRVFLRADLNVPINNGTILDDYRLKAIQPTIDLIQRKGGKVILATHIGRPEGYDPAFSTAPLGAWLTAHGYTVDFEPSPNNAYHKSFDNQSTILLLENLRFYTEEKNNDADFARILAELSDYYVNDAFALLHRNDTSITTTAKYFSPEDRSVGLLIEQELTQLAALTGQPKRPFILMLGGGKVADKIPLIKNLLPHIDMLLLCPAIVFTFLKALGTNVGDSLIDNESLDLCKKILDEAQQRSVVVKFPIDYQVAQNSFYGPLSIVPADAFPAQTVGIAVGPETVKAWRPIILQAQTIFYNGAMGDLRRSETMGGMNDILKAIADSEGLSIIGGGDSVAAAEQLGIAHNIDYLSTGGGATLAYLSGQPLPGLTPFISHTPKKVTN